MKKQPFNLIETLKIFGQCALVCYGWMFIALLYIALCRGELI